MSDDTLASLKSRLPTLQRLAFTVFHPTYDDEKKDCFEFFLDEEDEPETVDSNSAASTEAQDQM